MALFPSEDVEIQLRCLSVDSNDVRRTVLGDLEDDPCGGPGGERRVLNGWVSPGENGPGSAGGHGGPRGATVSERPADLKAPLSLHFSLTAASFFLLDFLLNQTTLSFLLDLCSCSFLSSFCLLFPLDSPFNLHCISALEAGWTDNSDWLSAEECEGRVEE